MASLGTLGDSPHAHKHVPLGVALGCLVYAAVFGDFIGIASLSCLEDTVLQLTSSSSDFYGLFIPLPRCSLSLGCCRCTNWGWAPHARLVSAF